MDGSGWARRLLAPVLILACGLGHAHAAEPDHDDDDDERAAPVTAIVVTAQRLDEARADVAPRLGATTYSLSSEAVEQRPGGETASVGQLLLQAPGVVQSGASRVQIRGQGELQYRINNVIVPEGVTDIGESLSTRLVQKVDVVTGALPAQYGLHTGGVVNIVTKNGVYNQGGQVELYGGGGAHLEPAYEAVGSWGRTSLFSSGSYVSDAVGLPSPDPSGRPLHDHTRQIEGLAFLDHIISPQARASVILGGSDERYQIPHPRGLDAAALPPPVSGAFLRPLTAEGTTRYPSEALGGEDEQSTVYLMASYQRSTAALTLQASLFGRYSTEDLAPDRTGDLLYSGAARALHNSDTGGGVQLDAVYRAGRAHTLRAGLVAALTGSRNHEAVWVLPVDAQGRQVSQTPQEIAARASEQRGRISLYLQDEWRFGDSVTLNPGLRFDHVAASGGGDRASPRLSLVWSRGGTTLHAGYARYFVPAPEVETPLPASAFAGTTGAFPGSRSDPLKAESDDYLDLGAERRLGRLTLGLDGYWRHVRDLIDELRIGDGPLRRPFNYADGQVRGVEASATYTSSRISAWDNVSAARAEGRRIVSNQAAFTGAELAQTSRRYVRTANDQTWTVSAGGSYRWRQANVSAQLVYGSGLPRTADGEPINAASMPAHVQLDLSTSYYLRGPAGSPIQLRLDLVNALDARAQLRDGTSLAGGPAEWSPARTVLVGVERSF